MGQTDRAGEVRPWMNDATGWSEKELALIHGAVFLGGALISLLRVVDVVIEAWPLPTSRVRR
jgi:hypothetical protein